jgi:hypothetical protein
MKRCPGQPLQKQATRAKLVVEDIFAESGAELEIALIFCKLVLME